MKYIITFMIAMTMVAGCSKNKETVEFNSATVKPGTEVTRMGQKLNLEGTPIQIGETLPGISLIDTASGGNIQVTDYKGKVVILSIVPSLNTKVCETQTHYLGEKGKSLSSDIMRITVSRDTPEEMIKFRDEAKLRNVIFLSDRGINLFGPSTGLKVSEKDILARSIIILDKEGIVRYIQVVPELTTLPDMEKAFKIARELSL